MIRSNRFKGLLLAAVAVAAMVFSGCGGKVVKGTETKEGGRIYLSGLFYQVQLSRQLNPRDVEDSFYLEQQPTPKPGESYFGVFMRVDNEDSKPRVTPVPISKMKITDAKGNVFYPIAVKSKGWGYEPAPLGKGAHIPIPDTPADIGPIRGGLILFRIPLSDLDSRPLVLQIAGPGGRTGRVTLDV